MVLHNSTVIINIQDITFTIKIEQTTTAETTIIVKVKNVKKHNVFVAKSLASLNIQKIFLIQDFIDPFHQMVKSPDSLMNFLFKILTSNKVKLVT